MKVILKEAEIQAAVQDYMGSDYDVKDIKVIGGRIKNSTRIEVEIERVQISNCVPISALSRDIKPAETVDTTAEKVQTGPIFSSIEED